MKNFVSRPSDKVPPPFGIKFYTVRVVFKGRTENQKCFYQLRYTLQPPCSDDVTLFLSRDIIVLVAKIFSGISSTLKIIFKHEHRELFLVFIFVIFIFAKDKNLVFECIREY